MTQPEYSAETDDLNQEKMIRSDENECIGYIVKTKDYYVSTM